MFFSRSSQPETTCPLLRVHVWSLDTVTGSRPVTEHRYDSRKKEGCLTKPSELSINVRRRGGRWGPRSFESRRGSEGGPHGSRTGYSVLVRGRSSPKERGLVWRGLGLRKVGKEEGTDLTPSPRCRYDGGLVRLLCLLFLSFSVYGSSGTASIRVDRGRRTGDYRQPTLLISGHTNPLPKTKRVGPSQD